MEVRFYLFAENDLRQTPILDGCDQAGFLSWRSEPVAGLFDTFLISFLFFDCVDIILLYIKITHWSLSFCTVKNNEKYPFWIAVARFFQPCLDVKLVR